MVLATVREDLFLHAPVEQVPAVLRHIHTSGRQARLDLLQTEVGNANEAGLALLDDIIEGPHRLFKGRVHVRPVDHVDVHVVSIEVLQALLDRGHDPLTAAVTEVRRLFIAYAELGHHGRLLAARTQSFRQRPL